MSKLTTFQQLQELGEGKYFCQEKGFLNWLRSFLYVSGWIGITNKGDYFDVLLCSNKEYHQRLNGPAYAASFHKDGTVQDVYQSAITMWPVRDAKEKRAVIFFLKKKINQAYNRQFS